MIECLIYLRIGLVRKLSFGRDFGAQVQLGRRSMISLTTSFLSVARATAEHDDQLAQCSVLEGHGHCVDGFCLVVGAGVAQK